jgi:hypothetical protein
MKFATFVGLLTVSIFLLVSYTSKVADEVPVDSQLRRNQLPKNPTNRRLSVLSGEIVRFELFNADTDTKILDLSNDMIVDLSAIQRTVSAPVALNVKAVVSGWGFRAVRSVRFGLNSNSTFSIENVKPFMLCGNSAADSHKCTKLGFGSHTITAKPFGFKNGRGLSGAPLSVTFTIVPERSTTNTTCSVPRVS